MLSAHISSRILNVFMASYPHGKTHKKGNEAEGEEEKKNITRHISLISYQQAENVQSQWTNPKQFHFWAAMELISSDSSVCLADLAADIKHYWIFPKTWAAGFWNLIRLMKAVLEIGGGGCRGGGEVMGGGGASNVSNLRAEMNLVLSGHRSISTAEKRASDSNMSRTACPFLKMISATEQNSYL